jgi:hypothetical protein
MHRVAATSQHGALVRAGRVPPAVDVDDAAAVKPKPYALPLPQVLRMSSLALLSGPGVCTSVAHAQLLLAAV